MVEAPKLEGTGPGADPVYATGPESSRGKTLIGFGKLFGLQDIYEGDEVRVRGGQSKLRAVALSMRRREMARPSGRVER